MMVFYRILSVLLGFLSVRVTADGTEVNIAGWGLASQSTLHETWYSEHALDGINSTCTHTQSQTDPWWRVNLQKAYSVDRVTITNRLDCCDDRINGAEIHIGDVYSDVFSNPLCAVVSSIPLGASSSYSCHGMQGQYVIVVIPGTSKILTLCDVGVYVIFPGNLATGKNVTQSSTFRTWIPKQAIDFNPGLTQPSSACSSTNTQANPWWSLDLRHIYRVTAVVITNRLDCCSERINGLEIRIGNSLDNNGNSNPRGTIWHLSVVNGKQCKDDGSDPVCYRLDVLFSELPSLLCLRVYGSNLTSCCIGVDGCAVISSIPAGGSSTFVCNHMEGRYVNLFLPGDSRTLTLCEVEVFGEGPCLKKSLVKLKLKSGFSLSEAGLMVRLLTELESALAQRSVTDVNLHWTQLPKQEIMRKEVPPAKCAQRKR